jgi:2-oxoisovalerate dehydrogenase E1 component
MPKIDILQPPFLRIDYGELVINNCKLQKKVLLEALCIRETEKKLLSLYSQGKISGTVHTCIGQELNGIAVASNLHSGDYILSNHRGHGHYLSRTRDYTGFFAEILGKTTGCSKGFGGSQHLRSARFFSNGIQGGMVPIGAGLALAAKYLSSEEISIVYIGDGTLGEGIVYEALNICSLLALPIVIVIENNLIAQSTSINQSMAGSIAARIQSFDIEYQNCETNDFNSMEAAISQAINKCRRSRVPQVIEIKSSRLFPHSKSDDNRDPTELEVLWEKDLIKIYESKFPVDYENAVREVSAYLQAVYEKVSEDESLILVDAKPHTAKMCFEAWNDPPPSEIGSNGINSGLSQLLHAHENVVLLGEDIEDKNKFNPGAYGGAFKVTKNLSNLYPGRVVNTPISEAAITGIATGMALGGMRPVLEIMFGDFLTLCFDQIYQHISKLMFMYGEELNLPLVIRSPMGGGRGYGPTHSQSIEKFFLGIPGLKIISVNHRVSMTDLYTKKISIIKSPLLIIENKQLYSSKNQTPLLKVYAYYQSTDFFPVIKITPQTHFSKPGVTIICYGGTLQLVEEAILDLFYKYEIFCEILCAMDITCKNVVDCVIESVQTTRNLLTVEEGTSVAAWSSMIVTEMKLKNCSDYQLKVLSNDGIVPAAAGAEKKVLPSTKKIIDSVLSLVRYAQN